MSARCDRLSPRVTTCNTLAFESGKTYSLVWASDFPPALLVDGDHALRFGVDEPDRPYQGFASDRYAWRSISDLRSLTIVRPHYCASPSQ